MSSAKPDLGALPSPCSCSGRSPPRGRAASTALTALTVFGALAAAVTLIGFGISPAMTL